MRWSTQALKKADSRLLMEEARQCPPLMPYHSVRANDWYDLLVEGR